MKLTYHVHVRVNSPKTEKERVQAHIKRKHGFRAILRGLAVQPVSEPSPDGTHSTSTPTVPHPGAQA